MSYERPTVPRPTFTIFHVLWLTVSVGIAWLVYFSVDARWIIRVVLALGGLLVTLALMHAAMVYIVTAWVIPRVKPNSYWNREVDSYMASVFPGQWV